MTTDHSHDEPYYPLGKLPQSELMTLLRRFSSKLDVRVVLGPGLGHDAAVIDFGDRYLVTKTDPITFATDQIGWYVVHINANDVACVGARPRWFVVTLLLPEKKTDRSLVLSIFDQVEAAAQELGVSVVGGHTEVTAGLDRPIAIGSMFGEIEPAHLVRSDGAQPGDSLILTKGIAVEGTAILARELAGSLTSKVDSRLIERASAFLTDPGLSVVKDAMIATSAGEVHAMHDPTEGGVATGIREMVEAANLGATIDAQALPYFPETLALCRALALDPLGLIASGALLLAVAPRDADTIVRALDEAGIRAAVIGQVRAEPGVDLQIDGELHPFPAFRRDEIARLFESLGEGTTTSEHDDASPLI